VSVAGRRNLHIIVGGRVQGVGYRAWAERTAREIGLVGWVRNLPDGSVEIRAEGDGGALELFVEKLWRGPSLAEVENVVFSEEPPREELSDFSVRR